LNLGCGSRPLNGAINHDRQQYAPHVDVWWDLEEPYWATALASQVTKRQMRGETTWNLLDDKNRFLLFTDIHVRDVLEHIRPDLFYQTMNEIWCLLEPGGLCHIQVPQYGSLNAVIDPTHWHGFHINSFDYLDPTTRLGKAQWTTDCRWKIVTKLEMSKTDVNLQFLLKKLS